MKQVWIIARKDIRETLRTRSTYMYFVMLMIMTLPYFAGSNTLIARLSRQGASLSEIRLGIQLFFNITAYTLPLIYTMLISGVFSAYSIALDKAKRTLESLMATPLSLRQIWLGKSLGVALPSVVISLVISALVMVVLNLVVAVPVAGSIIVPDALAMLTGFVLIPVITFLVVCIVSFIQLLIANARLASLAFSVIFLVIYFPTITELGTSWDFSIIYLMVTLVLVVITVILSRFLTKDRVTLSSKG